MSCQAFFGPVDYGCRFGECKIGGGDVEGDRGAREKAFQIAVLADVADSVVDRIGRGAELDRPAVQEQFHAVRPHGTVNAFGDHGPAGADQAGDAEDFALVKAELDVFQDTLEGEVFDPQHFFAWGDLEFRVSLTKGQATHFVDDLRRIEIMDIAGVRHFAVAQDGELIADLAQFVHPVRDIEDCGTALLEFADHAEQDRNLAIGQGRGWFVKNDDFGPGDIGLGNLDQMALGNVELADALV